MMGISEILRKVVHEKMTHAKSSTYMLNITFTQASAGLKIKPIEIKGMSIRQSFVGDSFDTIMLSCSFSPKDFLKMLENTQDLKCTILQCRWDREIYGCYNSEEPDIYEYLVVIANPQDILKQYPPDRFQPTSTQDYDQNIHNTPIDLDMQLVNQLDMDIKKKQINAVLADTDAESTVLYCLKAIGVEKSEIAKIDNTKKYRDVIIPPMTDAMSLFPYLQQKYGVFKKGISQYFTNGTMYIYAPHDTEPEKKNVVNIFKLIPGSVDGGDMYHVLLGEDLSIACFSDVSTQNTADAASENVGNAVAVKQADTSMGVNVNIDNKGTLTKNENATVIVKHNATNTVSKDSVQIAYGGTTNNIFSRLSDISAGQLEHIAIGWIHAKPFLITPGMKCIMHYDDTSTKDPQDVYTTVPGIVNGVLYELSLHQKDPEIVYRWNAKLALTVVPKEKPNAQETSSTTTSQTPK